MARSRRRPGARTAAAPRAPPACARPSATTPTAGRSAPPTIAACGAITLNAADLQRRARLPIHGSGMSLEELNAIRRLQALVELTRLVGEEESSDALLDEIARLLADTVGFSGVVINVHRPAWDDLQAVAVVGPQEMRDELLGATYPLDHFTNVALDERFERRGAYFIPDGAVDW